MLLRKTRWGSDGDDRLGLPGSVARACNGAMPHTTRIALLAGLVLLSCSLQASAQALPHVVISEVAWMGSDLRTSDEWIELARVGTGAAMSLSGWTLTSLNAAGEEAVLVRFQSGALIGSGQHLVVSGFPADRSRLAAEPWMTVSGMSVANTKLLLRLRTATGMLADSIDDGVGAPFAGLNNVTDTTGALGPNRRVWASMERIDLTASGGLKANWRSAATFAGFDDGAPLFGTPGFANGTGPSIDTFAPIDASDVRAWVESGSILVLWKPSTSLDVASQVLRIGTGSIAFSPTATGAKLYSTNTGAKLRLQAIDMRGNISTGSTISFQPSSKPNSSSSQEVSSSVSSLSSSSAISSAPACPAFDAQIAIQSGHPVATGKVTINVQAVSTGTPIMKLRCTFDYDDGFVSESCNPPSHTFDDAGSYDITVVVEDSCGTTLTRSLNIQVLPSTNDDEEDSEKEADDAPACSAGISPANLPVLSEFLPDPDGDDAKEEWIELQNPFDKPLSLCGLWLDDGEGGGPPHALGSGSIPPRAFVVFHRSQTSIALNNDADTVRLLTKIGSTFIEVENVAYTRAPQKFSFAKSSTGGMLWTSSLTPGKPNVFPARALATAAVSIASATGSHASYPKSLFLTELMVFGDEWIEIFNDGDTAVSLDGWTIDDQRDGGSKPFTFPAGTLVGPKEYIMFSEEQTALHLNDGGDEVWLLSPDGAVKDHVAYGKLMKESSYARVALRRRWCPTSIPTPLAANHCDVPQVSSAAFREDPVPAQSRKPARAESHVENVLTELEKMPEVFPETSSGQAMFSPVPITADLLSTEPKNSPYMLPFAIDWIFLLAAVVFCAWWCWKLR